MKKHLLTAWRPLGLCLLGALSCSLGSLPAKAQPAPANTQPAPVNPQPAQTTDPYISQLKSPNKDRRQDAYEELADFDQRLHYSVLTLLDELRKNPDRRVGGSFEMTLRVVSAMNIRDALDFVGGMIDFQLDPATMPAGRFGAATEYYPVAQTVIDLKDGPKTIELVMDRFDHEANDTTLRVYTHVLQGVLGPKIAKFVVQSNLDNMNKKIAIMPNAIGLQTDKTNLEGALKLLDTGGLILKMPEGN